MPARRAPPLERSARVVVTLVMFWFSLCGWR